MGVIGRGGCGPINGPININSDSWDVGQDNGRTANTVGQTMLRFVYMHEAGSPRVQGIIQAKNMTWP